MRFDVRCVQDCRITTCMKVPLKRLLTLQLDLLGNSVFIGCVTLHIMNQARIRFDEGLTLETSAFRIPVRWSIYIINSVDKTIVLCTISLETTHFTTFQTIAFIHCVLLFTGFVIVFCHRKLNSFAALALAYLFSHVTKPSAEVKKAFRSMFKRERKREK